MEKYEAHRIDIPTVPCHTIYHSLVGDPPMPVLPPQITLNYVPDLNYAKYWWKLCTPVLPCGLFLPDMLQEYLEL